MSHWNGRPSTRQPLPLWSCHDKGATADEMLAVLVKADREADGMRKTVFIQAGLR
jgi:hypothetical protein